MSVIPGQKLELFWKDRIVSTTKVENSNPMIAINECDNLNFFVSYILIYN